ncbi:hypothetical protein [Haloferax marisrubri]|uniref:hypothetical protein n=1 Tax=Haloferax marisrubri TaxID=1544719 RepID=UPI000A7BF3C7|nr:hypothetical protein [Haloferax marisrubri]
MSQSWFTEKGASGRISLERTDDGWFVVDPGEVGKTKCVLEGNDDLGHLDSIRDLDITISNFRWGTGNNVNYLYGRVQKIPVQEKSQKRPNKRTESESNQTKRQQASTNELWELDDFSGSGKYVDVEATIDAIFFIKKNTGEIPDMKGELTDDSVFRPVTFIVEDGVKHPYLGEGKKFRFEGVKDHYYKKEHEIQVVINKNTDFVELN